MEYHSSKPPRLARWFLKKMIKPTDFDFAIGDLTENYQSIVRKENVFSAWGWFWMEVLRSLPRFVKNAIYWRFVMFRNYFKMMFRSLRKYKVYSFINVVGLAMGMACCILILLWVYHEMSYDRFHEKKDRIYRVLQYIKYSEVVTWAITQGPLGPALKEEIPEFEDVVRYENARWRMKYNEDIFVRRGGYVDPSFLSMFSFPLIKGDPERALSDPHAMVITEELAETMFGMEDPMGKTIHVADRWDMKVTGVLKNIPDNSHLQFDFLGNMAFAREVGYTVDIWTNSTFITYVLLPENIPAEIVDEKIYNFLDTKPTLEDWEKLSLQALTKIHFSTSIGYDNAVKTNPQYVVVFFGAALFILLIACINFMNLSTARSTLRSKEVGLRKVAGAYRGQLIHQFLGESLMLSILSFIVAMGLVILFLPMFNQLSGKQFTLDVFGTPHVILGVFTIVLSTGILSGSYPAFILSAFKPVKVLKSTLGTGTGKSILRRILVVFQFSISILLLIGTMIIYSQVRFLQNQDIGYDKENLIYLPAPPQIRQQYDTFKNELLKNPKVLNVSASTSHAAYGITFTNGLWNWEGKNEEEDILFRGNFVNYDYFKTFSLRMVSGRSFSRTHATDSSAIIINEKALEIMGLGDPIGKRVNYGRNPDEYTPFHIIGVVKDFNFLSLHTEIEPLVILLSGGRFGFGNPSFIYVRIAPEHIDETIKFLENQWNRFSPDYSFDFGFLDESFDRLYRAEERIGNILKSFTILAVFVSCLGLFGLASFMVMRRTKEIGVRKVLGASFSKILFLLVKEFSTWIIVANIISWPVAYFAMNRWLQNFAYRTSVQLWIFIAAGFVTLMISMLTVSYQAVKAARANPVDALRYE